MGERGDKFEVVCLLACISREEGGWTDIKNAGGSRVIMVKTLIIYARLNVWAQLH